MQAIQLRKPGGSHNLELIKLEPSEPVIDSTYPLADMAVAFRHPPLNSTLVRSACPSDPEWCGLT